MTKDNSKMIRWLSRSTLAVYIDVTVNTVDAMVRDGRLPRPTYKLGRPRWDRLSVDDWMDNSNDNLVNGFDDDFDAVLDRFSNCRVNI